MFKCVEVYYINIEKEKIIIIGIKIIFLLNVMLFFEKNMDEFFLYM